MLRGQFSWLPGLGFKIQIKPRNSTSQQNSNALIRQITTTTTTEEGYVIKSRT
jgi:hypothetical protein